MTCAFINDLRNLVNFTVELKNPKICTLRDSFFKLYIVELGNYRRVICHGGAKFLKKLTGGLKNDIRNFVNFNGSSRKFALWWAPFSVAYKVLAKKMQKRYLSWYWRVIQTLKKNSLFVWKMSWGIWWILAWAVENLENYFDGLLLSKGCKFWAKKIQRSCAVKNDLWFQKWHKKVGEFHTSSWK